MNTSSATHLDPGAEIELTVIHHSENQHLSKAEPLSPEDVKVFASAPSISRTPDMTIRQERIYLATLSWCLFVAGWNDATLGPLLPRIQQAYHVNYTVVSMLFVCGCLGVITGAGCNVYLSDKLGFGKLITIGWIATYAAMAPAPPFPVMCTAYYINGYGLAIQDAQANTFIASIPRNAATNMGILHAAYGLGAFTSPLIATQFAQRPKWSFHFLVSAGVAFLNATFLASIFRFRHQEKIPHADTITRQGNKYKQIFLQRSVHIMSLFILVYVGVEVTIGGWIFTYLLQERGGGPSSGYVSSGFFGGLTLGRVILLPINDKIGPKRAVYVYSILAIALELTVWLVPNLIENAVAVSIVGLLLGPFYPTCMNVTADILPSRLLAGSIGWIAAFGQAGAAVFPFMTGALASKYGVQVLQPLLVAMMVMQIILWFWVVRAKPARED